MKTKALIMTRLNRNVLRSVNVSALFILYCNQSFAISWSLTPYLQAQEIYSDNIRLASSGLKQGAFVTAINPSLSIFGQSAKSRLNLNYSMQNLFNSGGNNGFSTYHQLQSNSQNTLIQNKLFLNSYSSISQQNINNNRIGASNINGSSNNINVYSFGISPYWTPHFGNFAYGTAVVNANTFSTSGGNNVNTNNNSINTFSTISDSINVSETLNLNSGSYFQRLNWGVSFNNNENFRVNSPNIKFQNSTGRVSTSINKKFNVFAQGGYSKSDYQTTTNNNNNGFYYTIGGQWIPSQRYSMTAGAGNNSYVSIYISPISRLTWTTTYTNNSVGTNFGQFSGGNSTVGGTSNSSQFSGVNGGGNANENWQTALNYQTRRSSWSLTHSNNTTTTQQLLSQLNVFPNQNQNSTDPSQFFPQPNPRITNIPTLTNDVIISKTWNLSASFATGKSVFSVNAYDQNYQYQSNGTKQDAIGLSGSWNWQFASKTNAYFTPQWQHTVARSNVNTSQFYALSVGVRQAITSRLYGVLEFRHTSQISDTNTATILPLNGSANNYEENRATASLSMRF